MAARLAGPRIPPDGVGLAIRARMTRSASCRRRARKQSGRHYSAASWLRSREPALSGHYLREGDRTAIPVLVHGAHAELHVVFGDVERDRGDVADSDRAGPG